MVFGMGWGAGGGGMGNRLGQAARGTAGIAATVLGLRVSRAATLRVSALLALRSLLAPLELPLSSYVASALWAAAFAAAQTAALAAAAADRLRLPGALGRWGAALFSPVDAPFVALYAAVVLVLGPLIALGESIVVVYEVVRLTRALEDRMNADPAVEAHWKRIIVGASAVAAGGTAAAVGLLPVPEVAPAVGCVAAALLGVTLFTAAGNVLHAALLSAYAALLAIAGVAEHLDLFPAYGLGRRAALHSPEARAALFLVSAVLTLAGLPRVPAFVRAVLHGADAVAADPALAGGPGGGLKGLLNALAVVALTFRFLVYHQDVLPGEYYPLVCRGLQVVVVVGLYAGIMRMEGQDGNHECPGS
jgi:hypothetical protein